MDFPSLAARRSSLAFRRSDQFNIDPNLRRMSLFEAKANGEVNRNLRNLIVKVRSSLLLPPNIPLPFSMTIPVNRS